MEMSFEPPTEPHHKRAGKIAGYVVIGVISFLLMSFIAMFSYFLWVEKYGDPDTKAKYQTTFNEQFSSLAGAGNTQSTITEDIHEYIRSHNPDTGNRDASVTLLVFIDFECPYCRDAYTTFEQIRETYGPAVHIVFKHFPIEQFHPYAGNAARAAQCADEQGTFWQYYQQLFETKQLDDQSLMAHARTLRLNTASFAACMSDESTSRFIAKDIEDALALGVRGTPTYILNNQKLEGVIPIEKWNTIIIEALNQ